MDPLHTDVQVLENQIELINNSFIQTQDVILKTYRKRWKKVKTLLYYNRYISLLRSFCIVAKL